MIAAGLCAVWYTCSMPVILRMMREHPPARTNDSGKGVVYLVASELLAQFTRLATKYPEALKFLIAHMLACGFGGPIIVTLVSTYLPAQLGITNGIQVSLVALVVLLVGAGATPCLASLKYRDRVSFKLLWVVVLGLNIVIGLLVPLLARSPTFLSYIFVLVIAGALGAVAISWFYSIGWPCFITLVPPSEVSAYAGIFAFLNAIPQPFALLINSAIVQATNSHALAWAITIVPLSAVSLVLMLLVDYDKGKRAAGRTDVKAPGTMSA